MCELPTGHAQPSILPSPGREASPSTRGSGRNRTTTPPHGSHHQDARSRTLKCSSQVQFRPLGSQNSV
jgi:hypothetical protein